MKGIFPNLRSENVNGSCRDACRMIKTGAKTRKADNSPLKNMQNPPHKKNYISEGRVVVTGCGSKKHNSEMHSY